MARGSAAASGRYLRDPVLGDPAGDALAERDPQLVRGLVDVFADLTAHRDRDEVRLHEPIDPGVVIVDELAQLGHDREPDVLPAREVVEPRSELLDRLELRGPGRHLLEVLRGPDGDARLGRQGGDRFELVRRPAVRLVVVDVEQPQELRAIHQRRGAERVEALLHDGRPDAAAARVVRIAHGEQRPASGDGQRRQRPLREVADRGQVLGRQAAADLGRDRTVRALEEDRRAVTLEQHHRVIDEAGEDAVEVEPAPDVARDAAQGLRAMEQVRNLLLASTDGDERAEGVGDDPDEVQVERPEAVRPVGHDQHDAPRTVRSHHGDRHLGSRAGQARERHPVAGVREDRDGGRRRLPGECRPGRGVDRPAEDAEPAREVEQARAGGARRQGRCARHEAVVADLPDGDEAMVVRVPDEPGDVRQVVVQVIARERRPRDGIEQRQVAVVSLRPVVARLRPGWGARAAGPGAGRPARRARGRAVGLERRRDRRGIERTPRGQGRRQAGLGLDVLRRGEEPLQVTEPIASVTAGVDPVVPQTTGVAPRANGVRVDPEHVRRLGDGQGGVSRP